MAFPVRLSAFLFLACDPPASDGWPALVEYAGCCGVDRVLRHQALAVEDPKLGHERIELPVVLQFDFAHADAWNRLAAGGALAQHLGAEAWAGAQVQVMRACLDEPSDPGERAPHVSYFAAYEGDARAEEDERAWQAEYLAGHVPLMRQLPGVCSVRVWARVPFEPLAGARPLHWLLRNVVTFERVEDLRQALASSQRQRLYEHRLAKLPRLGQATHFAYRSHVFLPSSIA